VSNLLYSNFLKRFNDETIPSIPFICAWNDGSVYFDGAFHGFYAVSLAVGEIKKSLGPKGEKVLFIGTKLGPVAAFVMTVNINVEVVFQTVIENYNGENCVPQSIYLSRSLNFTYKHDWMNDLYYGFCDMFAIDVPNRVERNIFTSTNLMSVNPISKEDASSSYGTFVIYQR
jgi:hypothetical protein